MAWQPITRIFNGEKFEQVRFTHNKTHATGLARTYRLRGHKARVVKAGKSSPTSPQGYAVFVSVKKRR